MFYRRTVNPGPGAFVCSCHFRDGKKENGPELFLHNQEKKFSMHYLSPERKKTCNINIGDVNQYFMIGEKKEEACTKPKIDILQNITIGKSFEQSVAVPSTSKECQILDIPNELVTSKQSQFNQCVRIDVDISPSLSPVSDAFLSPTALEAENYFLKQEVDQGKVEIKNLKRAFSYKHICETDKLVLLYTGIPTAKLFSALFNLVKDLDINYYLKWKVEKLSKEDQLLLTLMKLRQNFPHADLAERFNISQSTVTNILITWINVLEEVLHNQLMEKIPPRSKNASCLPGSFSSFTNCRIILDCTEIYTVVDRKSMTMQKATYSTYKHRNTYKGLVGVAPNGVITYVSGLYPGSTSDKKVVAASGILQQLEAGDLVIADKGFLISELLPPGVSLNIPPFLSTPQFTAEQIKATERIARARIHVERAIRRMKCYKILHFIPHSLLKYAENVFKVVAALTNFQYPLIQEVEQYYVRDME